MIQYQRSRSIDELLADLGTSPSGLTAAEVQRRRSEQGLTSMRHTPRLPWTRYLLDTLRNPLNVLLACLCIVSFVTGDVLSTAMIGAMIIVGGVLRFIQESRSERAIEQLQQLVRTTVRVIREGAEQDVDIDDLVPGDIIRLSAGDLVPADVRLLESDDMHVDQHLLTGESLPVEKSAHGVASDSPLDDQRLCFKGSTVQTGYATAIVIEVGADTYFGSIAASIGKQRPPTSFDKGIRSFTWLMLRIILVLVPTVFLLNGLLRGDWLEALLFAVAVAVGITPEMLPMIVTVNLSKGAVAMAKRKVIVKHINSIQNLGAMDVLCADKTGTLTQGRIVLMQHIRPDGEESEDVLLLGYLNSYFESGLRNIMDEAVLDHQHLEDVVHAQQWIKHDEQPFDFVRRRLTVLLQRPDAAPIMICKGALEETLACCVHVPDTAVAVADRLSSDGFRVVAVATRTMPMECSVISELDEREMHLEGFLAFLDPPKESALQAIQDLNRANIDIKILTGDRLAVTTHVGRSVGLPVKDCLEGPAIDHMSDEELSKAVEHTSIFAKLTPLHKERVIAVLRSNGHVVGFIGDGINDAPALRGADVGISVDEAVDIAKESSDIILLERSLDVLHDGVVEGRRVFGNVVKYLRMAASSNVGNMLSVIGASIFLPFLPMLPVQIMLNNLLYDLSQTAIPTDHIGDDWLKQPRVWSMSAVQATIVLFGPISSVFDYATYAVLLGPLQAADQPALFHTGWFIESLMSQMLIVYILRSRRWPWSKPLPSKTLMATTLLIMFVALWLPYSPVASTLGFVTLPLAYWGWLLFILVVYMCTGLAALHWVQRRDKTTMPG